MTQMPASLDIIIVNWNAGVQLRECLWSIAETDRHGFTLQRVIVVDNASRDGSALNLQDLPLPLTVIRNCENRGFAASCNQGARESAASYILFLNPDTRLFRDSLARLFTALHTSGDRVGIASLQLVNGSGRVTRSCARFPTPKDFFVMMLGLNKFFPRLFPSYFMTEWDHADSRWVNHVTGAFFLVRRAIFEALGGFDERFFVYLEDLDFSLRAHRAGWQSFYCAESQAYHRGGGTSEQAKDVRLFFALRSRILYAFKHFSWRSAAALFAATLLVEPLVRLFFLIVRGSAAEIRDTFKGYRMLWSEVPSLLRATLQGGP